MAMITLPGGTRIWLAAGMTDMRKGFDGLAALVQGTLAENPFSGHVFVFRGRAGDRVKVLWWDGSGVPVREAPGARAVLWPQAKAVCAHDARAALDAARRHRLAPSGENAGAESRVLIDAAIVSRTQRAQKNSRTYFTHARRLATLAMCSAFVICPMTSRRSSV
jgi:transposase